MPYFLSKDGVKMGFSNIFPDPPDSLLKILIEAENLLKLFGHLRQNS